MTRGILALTVLLLREEGDTLSQLSWCLSILVALVFLAVAASHYVGVPWGDFVSDGLR